MASDVKEIVPFLKTEVTRVVQNLLGRSDFEPYAALRKTSGAVGGKSLFCEGKLCFESFGI
jgi:hypothetical protein